MFYRSCKKRHVYCAFLGRQSFIFRLMQENIFAGKTNSSIATTQEKSYLK